MSSFRNAPWMMVRLGTAAPTANADFIGQFFVKTTATAAAYIAVAVGTGASDWLQIG